MADTVLIVTHTADHFTVDRVAAALEHLGARPVRFDTDLFPLESKLSVRIDSRGLRQRLSYRGTTIDAGEVRAIWMRKLWTPRMDESLDEQYQTMCVSESVAMLRGFLDGFQEVVWVNDPICELAAEIKMRQLRLATEVGLRVPRTLNTNDPEEARAFYDELGGRMVTKLLRPLSFSMGAAPVFMYTSEVRAEDLADAEMLRHSPMVFQETIPKSEELRVAYVGGRVFAGAIDASGSRRGRVDWRLAAPDECDWKADELPHHVTGRLTELMSRLGLVYGAIDLIRTPNGEFVFLEVNPGGEWGMLEKSLDLPISTAIAEALLNPDARRQ